MSVHSVKTYRLHLRTRLPFRSSSQLCENETGKAGNVQSLCQVNKGYNKL